MLSESLESQALRELNSNACPTCPNSKKPGHSFCYSCYGSLPKKMQNELYTLMSQGYAEIYDRTKEYLKITLED